MARRRKYKPGSLISSTAEAVLRIEAGEYLMVSHGTNRPIPRHPRVVENWSVITIRVFVSHGRLRVAELNEGHSDE